MIITLLTGKTSKLKDKIKKELDLEVKINQTSRAKKMTLKIDSKLRQPVLTVPTIYSSKAAFDFIQKQLGWIEDKLSQIAEPQKFTDGETISIFGKELTILHCPNLKSGVFIDENYLKVSGDIAFLHRRVKDFIKKQAKLEFYKISKAKASSLGCKLGSVVIKDTKSRWGSCSSMNNINYNWRVALAPDFVIDYLTSHEVCHLKHQDHSKNFWNCVATLSPQYPAGKHWLQTHAKDLNVYE